MTVIPQAAFLTVFAADQAWGKLLSGIPVLDSLLITIVKVYGMLTT